MRNLFLLTLHFTLASFVYGQALPDYIRNGEFSTKNIGKRIFDEMVRIEGGSFLMLGNSIHFIEPQNVTLSSFYIQDREVTNLWYKLFLYDLAKTNPEKALLMMPDSSVWVKEFTISYNEPLMRMYFSNKAYDNYPVVGVNYHQAVAFAYWANEKVKSYLETLPLSKQVKIEFRLPSAAEWQYAASGGIKQTCYGFRNESENLPDCSVFGLYDDKKNKFRANYKNDEGLYLLDGMFNTGPVKSFPANPYGLYDMIGNVSEWVSDLFVFYEKFSAERKTQNSTIQSKVYSICGGSFCDDYTKQYINTINPFHADSSHAYIGFRLAASIKND